VETLDYSIAGIKILENTTKEKKLSLKPQMLNIKRPLPFPNIYFDAVHTHMLFNIRFSMNELHFIFSEI
jgi:hypothetical protein